MKKFVLVLFLISSLSAVSAEKEADAILTLNLKEGEGTYSFGFSSSEVDSYVSSVMPTLGEYSEIKVEPGKDYGENDKLYFFWKILSENKIELTLSLEGPLSNGSDYIDWNVRWDRKLEEGIRSGSLSSADGDSSNTVYIFREDGQSAANSVKLYVQTESVAGKSLGQYTGTITATIRSLGE